MWLSSKLLKAPLYWVRMWQWIGPAWLSAQIINHIKSGNTNRKFADETSSFMVFFSQRWHVGFALAPQETKTKKKWTFICTWNLQEAKYGECHHLVQKLYFHPENLVGIFRVPATFIMKNRMLLYHQSQLFGFASWHDEAASLSELGQTGMNFDLTLWLANENCSRVFPPKNSLWRQCLRCSAQTESWPGLCFPTSINNLIQNQNKQSNAKPHLRSRSV